MNITIKKSLKLLTNSNRRRANQIALYLEKKCITGYCGVDNECPLANYLYKKTKYKYNIQIWDDKIFYFKHGLPDKSFKLTKELLKFIRNFDNKKYPNLIKT